MTIRSVLLNQVTYVEAPTLPLKYLQEAHFYASNKSAITQYLSQPYVGTIPAGNIMISAAILYTGLMPEMVLRVLSSLNCATIKRMTFFITKMPIYNKPSTVFGRQNKRL